MNTINEIQDNIVADFAMFEDWNDKYEYLIEFGKSLQPLEEQYKIEDNLIKGCQSRVWLIADTSNNNIIFKADSDAIITKGIVGLLVKVLSNHSADNILSTDLYFLDKIGLKEHLSPTRANGLVAMVKQMKNYALAFKAKQII